MSAHDTLIKLFNVSKSFGQMRALDDVSFELHRGSVTALLGINGAGKTTLMRLLCALDVANTGSIHRHKPARQLIGYCPQQLLIWPDLTCTEQLTLIGELCGLDSKRSSHTANALLEELELFEKRGELASSLSGGMKRRLSLAMSLVHDPEVLILDEPEAGLDPHSRVVLRRLLERLARERGKCVLLSTHGVDEIERTSDRVLILHHGALLADGSPEQIITTHAGRQHVELELSPHDTIPNTLLEHFGDIKTRDNTFEISTNDATSCVAAVIELLRARCVEPKSLTIRSPGLEDAFLALTREEKTP